MTGDCRLCDVEGGCDAPVTAGGGCIGVKGGEAVVVVVVGKSEGGDGKCREPESPEAGADAETNDFDSGAGFSFG